LSVLSVLTFLIEFFLADENMNIGIAGLKNDVHRLKDEYGNDLRKTTEISDSTCLICGKKLIPWKMKGLLYCHDCGFVTTDLEISDEELLKIYSADYFHGDEYSNYLEDKKTIQRNFKEKLNILIKKIDTHYDQQSLFEIGCAYGFFLELAKGMFSKVSGIDISTDAINFARENLKLDVQAGDFMSMPPIRADIFCLWDTIEHVKKPEKFIQKISNDIVDGGLIAITTGDINSFIAKIRGKNWRQIHPPTHLHYFSKRSLIKLLEKNGFEIVHVSYQGQFLSLDMIGYIILVLHHNLKWFYYFLKKTNILKCTVWVNMFDTVYIIGKKLSE
jgi:SAM-dependent methyltransferase